MSLTRLYPGVGDSTDDVTLKEEAKLILDVLFFSHFSQYITLVVLKRCYSMLSFELLEKSLVPCDEVDITIKITAGHLVWSWSFAFLTKHYHIL